MGTRNWKIVSEIFKEHSNFILKNLEHGTFTTWKMKVLCSFKGAKNDCPMARSHIPEEWNPEALRGDNLKISKSVITEIGH